MDSELTAVLHGLSRLGRALGAKRLVLFGSRARGDFRERSDIDVAVYGLDERRRADFLDGVDALATLLKFDIVFVSDETAGDLLANIEKDGVPIMGKFDEKYEKLALAVRRLREGADEYAQNRSTTMRDGVIQRFEFCTELAWKATREYLIDQGYTDLNSPKAVMKQAYADGLISDGELWAALLNDRNLTSHIYDEATASAVFGRINADYLPMFDALASALRGQESDSDITI